MEVQFTPDLQARLEKLVAETGRPAGEFVQAAVAAYIDELEGVRATLDSRYDDLRSGRVTPVSGDEVLAHFREKIADRRAQRA